MRSVVVLGLVTLSACGFELTLAPTGTASDANSTGEPDAIIDAPFGAMDAPLVPTDMQSTQQWVKIDTLAVPSNGASVLSNVSLAADTPYKLVASGTFIVQNPPGTQADAEWWDFNNPSGQQEGVPGVDIGLAVDDSVVDENRTPKWGPYNPLHVYEAMYTGLGRQLVANIHDGNPTNNSGTLTLEVFALQ